MDYSVSDSGHRVVFTGKLTEASQLQPLLSELATGDITFDLAGVIRINSVGVRNWVEFLRNACTPDRNIQLTRCSVPFVLQLNMIGGFANKADVKSFYLPYVCDSCGGMADELVNASGPFPDPERRTTCPDCGGVVEADYLPSEYLSFLAKR